MPILGASGVQSGKHSTGNLDQADDLHKDLNSYFHVGNDQHKDLKADYILVSDIFLIKAPLHSTLQRIASKL